MRHVIGLCARYSIATIIGSAALFWSGNLPLSEQASLVSSADARVGRPLTPMSYAGVARRTTRRTVRRTVAVGAVAVGAAARCVQVVDAYGRIITRC
jgi:hypothetical protein